MWTFILRELTARPGRALLSLLGTTIGVAVLMTVSVAGHAAQRAHENLYQAIAGHAALEITSRDGGAFRQDSLPSLTDLPMIRAAAPVVRRPTIIYQKSRKLNVSAVGFDPGQQELVHDYRLAAGRIPERPLEIMLDQSFARGIAADLGAEVKVMTRRGVRRAAVVGLLAPASAGALHRGGMLFFALGEAQSLFGQPNRVDAIQIVLAADVDQDAALSAIAVRLPPELDVRRASSSGALGREVMRNADVGLKFASALIIEIALFLILHTALMNVHERRARLAMLRVVGATRGQVIVGLLLEAVVIGTAAAALGLAAGILGGRALTGIIGHLLQTELPPLAVSWRQALLAAAIGQGLAIIGTCVPAFVAGRVSPLDVLRNTSAAARFGPSLAWGLLGMALAVMAGGLSMAYASGHLGVESAVGAAAFALLAFALMLPMAFPALARLAGATFDWLWGAEGALARAQLLQAPLRAGLSVGVLFVAFAAGLGMASALLGQIGDARNWFERTMIGDFFVRIRFPDPSTGMAAVMPDDLRGRLEAVPGVTGVDSFRFLSGKAEGQAIVVIVRELKTSDLGSDIVESVPNVAEAYARGDVLIGTALAQRQGKRIGDSVAIETNAGPKSLRIAGIVNEYTVGGQVVSIERRAAARLFDVEGADIFVAHADPNARVRVQKELDELCRAEGLMNQPNGDFRRLFEGMMAGVTGSVWLMLALGVVVAVFGIANTLAMNVLEQRREIGLLRAVGMTRAQVRKTVLAQAALMGICGLAPGVVAGFGVAYAISLSTSVLLGHQLPFEWRPVLAVTGFAFSMLLVLVAALASAERAARLNVSTVLQFE